MRVDVSGAQFIFPPRCVCCGGFPDTAKSISASRTTGKRVIHVSTNSWAAPYCSQCLGHEDLLFRSQAKRRSATTAVAIFIGVGFGEFVLLGGSFGFTASFVIGVLIGLLGIAPFLKISGDALELEQQAKSSCTSSCCAVSNAAGFYGWDGTLNSFEFVSQGYAGEFMVANRQKLVNLSAAQVNWLNSIGPTRPVGAPQRPQRFRV